MRSTRMPEKRAAVALVPMAKMRRPVGIRCSTMKNMAAQTRKMGIITGSLKEPQSIRLLRFFSRPKVSSLKVMVSPPISR